MPNVLRELRDKIFGIDDSPAKVALGMGIGVFFGVMPGMGPLIAAFIAVIIKANRASALAGAILTNTWLSIPVFVIAVAIGGLITGFGSSGVSSAWSELCVNFTWRSLFTLSVYKVLIPVMAGYAAVSFTLGTIAYFATFAALRYANVKRRIL